MMLVLALIPSAASGASRHTVYASVTSGSGSIQAVLVPGEFTVPQGQTATVVRFVHDNPATGYHSEKLGPSNIYSVNLGRYMTDAQGNPLFQLPPGQYRFVVGGHPGATGSLTYDLVP
jgi:hypothetical protein